MKTESNKEFNAWFLSQPVLTTAYRVRTFDGNTGNKVGVEWSDDLNDLDDMLCVSNGYYTETAVLTRCEATNLKTHAPVLTLQRDYQFSN